MRLIVIYFCLFLALLLASTSDAWSDSQELSREEALFLGRTLLAEGRPTPAQAIAEALLRTSPRDNEARILMAAALQDQGDHAQAHSFAQAAHRHGEADQTRFEAAMLAGRSEFNRNAYGRSQFWLRRAAHVAPDDAARDLAVRNFRQVRRINPLDLRFNVGLRRSSNINNGTSTDVITLLGLPFQVSGNSRALSGLELGADMALRYRINQSQRRETALTLDVLTRSYRLSQAARVQAPEERSRDYNFQRLEVGIQHRFALSGSQSSYEISTVLGRDWYGGRPLRHHARLSLSQATALRPNTVLQLSLSGQKHWHRDTAQRNATRIGGAAQIRHMLERGDQVALRFGGEHTRAKSIHIRNHALHVGLGYTLSEPVFGARLDTMLDLEDRRFPAAALQPEGRRDRTATLGVAAMFEDIDYMGFVPVLRMEMSSTRSNIAIHKRRAANISLEIRSSF